MKLEKSIKYLIVLAIFANAVGIFFPSLRSTFVPYYGSIAKHIAVSGDWSNLMLLNQDWLDKPHLPFWLTALSYQIFGFNSFAYILPGFLFHLLGLYYTYKLARFWYSREVGLLAVLFTASALHIMLSSIDIRAEAFMLGEIMPACYFFLRYDKHGGLSYLLGGAFFTALALMTKGLIALITIISGIALLWIYRGKWRNFISLKWIFALCLSILLVFPEIWALYLQFDAHPEKIMYGHTNVSGIKWFFWDSQFGRFLGTGPISNHRPDVWHYFFFIHTFLWSYLPWWPMFLVALWQFIKDFIKDRVHKDAEIFLFASFFVTFIVFSISTYQVDHYTNILFPFASIICAAWLHKVIVNCKANCRHPIFYVENTIATILLLAVLVITPWVLSGLAMWSMLILDILAWGCFISCRSKGWQYKIIAFPTIAISIVFIFAMLVNGTEYAKYDGGYQIATYLNAKKNITVVSYKAKDQNDMLSLNLHSDNPYQEISDLSQIATLAKPVYLVVESDDLPGVLAKLPGAQIEKTFAACTIETFIANVLDPVALNKKVYTFILLRVPG